MKKKPTQQEFDKMLPQNQYYWEKTYPGVYQRVLKKRGPEKTLPSMEEFKIYNAKQQYYWKKNYPEIFGETKKLGIPPSLEEWETMSLQSKQRYHRLYPDVFPKATVKPIPTVEEFSKMTPNRQFYWKTKHPEIFGKTKPRDWKPTLEEFQNLKSNHKSYYRKKYPGLYPYSDYPPTVSRFKKTCEIEK